MIGCVLIPVLIVGLGAALVALVGTSVKRDLGRLREDARLFGPLVTAFIGLAAASLFVAVHYAEDLDWRQLGDTRWWELPGIGLVAGSAGCLLFAAVAIALSFDRLRRRVKIVRSPIARGRRQDPERLRDELLSLVELDWLQATLALFGERRPKLDQLAALFGEPCLVHNWYELDPRDRRQRRILVHLVNPGGQPQPEPLVREVEFFFAKPLFPLTGLSAILGQPRTYHLWHNDDRMCFLFDAVFSLTLVKTRFYYPGAIEVQEDGSWLHRQPESSTTRRLSKESVLFSDLSFDFGEPDS